MRDVLIMISMGLAFLSIILAILGIILAGDIYDDYDE